MNINILERNYKVTCKFSSKHVIIKHDDKKMILYKIKDGWESHHKDDSLDFLAQDIMFMMDIMDFLFRFEKQLN